MFRGLRCKSDLPKFLGKSLAFRGDDGNRTHGEGFADPCLATWRRRQMNDSTPQSYANQDDLSIKHVASVHFKLEAKLLVAPVDEGEEQSDNLPHK